MLDMTNEELNVWYDIMVLQQTEEEVVNNLRKADSKGNVPDLPPPDKIREIVIKRIKERNKQAQDRYKFLVELDKKRKLENG